MKQSYLKYIETTEMVDEGPTSGLTRLQHVGVVSVLDENGNEWFPDTEIPDPVQPLAVATESIADKDNIYKWGEEISFTTATFKDGEEPYEIWARGKYRIAGESNYTDTPKIFYDNVATTVTFTIPQGTDKVGFFTACNDSRNPTQAEYVNSVVEGINVLQPSVTIENSTGSTVIAEAGKRNKIEVRTSNNYNPEYFWQFQDQGGSFRNASEANVAKYYPEANYILFDGFQTPSFNFTWVAGGPGPEVFRCRVRDVYIDDVYDQDFTNNIQVVYPASEKVDPLELAEFTPAKMSEDNVYQIGKTIGAYTAEFIGGIQPVSNNVVFIYQKRGSREKLYSSFWNPPYDESTYYTFRIPPDTDKIQFSCTARESGPIAAYSKTSFFTCTD